jgi:hypothetical protein
MLQEIKSADPDLQRRLELAAQAKQRTSEIDAFVQERQAKNQGESTPLGERSSGWGSPSVDRPERKSTKQTLTINIKEGVFGARAAENFFNAENRSRTEKVLAGLPEPLVEKLIICCSFDASRAPEEKIEELSALASEYGGDPGKWNAFYEVRKKEVLKAVFHGFPEDVVSKLELYTVSGRDIKTVISLAEEMGSDYEMWGQFLRSVELKKANVNLEIKDKELAGLVELYYAKAREAGKVSEEWSMDEHMEALAEAYKTLHYERIVNGEVPPKPLEAQALPDSNSAAKIAKRAIAALGGENYVPLQRPDRAGNRPS